MNSKDYWITREREHMERMMKLDKDRAAEIKRIYERTMTEVQKEIDRFYSVYAGKENIDMEEARKRVSKHDVQAFQDKAKEYVKNKDFSPRANQELRLYNSTMKINRLELLKSNIGLELVAMSDAEYKSVIGYLKQQIRAEFRRQAGILGMTVIRNEKLVNQIVNASFYNATFSDRIWNNQTELKAQLDKLLTNGLVQGKNPRELARGLRKEFGVSEYNAERLMITELGRVQTASQKAAYEEYDISQYQFLAEIDACPDCSDLDGRIFDVKDMQSGVNANPIHSRCRCSTAAHVDRKAWEADLTARGL